jgi:hypothetical protein
MSFEITLNRMQLTNLWKSEGPEKSPMAARLQELFDTGMTEKYDLEKKAMEEGGAKFRLTRGKVFQISDSDEMITVPIVFQVKGGCLTWYIQGPMDETHQEFRDEVYGAAGLGHLGVEGHCEKYWRGTNSLHVKKMHTSEAESGFNHNHYRMGDRDVDPKAVYQHLYGFVKAQEDLGLIEESSGRAKFLDRVEADEIYRKFERFWVESTHVGPATTINLNGEDLHLPAREESLVDMFKKSPGQVLTPEDIAEWEANRAKEEPCLVIKDWESLSVRERLKAIAEGMRGLGSEFAQTRQMAGSKYETHSSVVKRDDQVSVLA